MARNKSEKMFLGMKIFPIIIFCLILGVVFYYRDVITLENLLNFTPKNKILAIVYVLICFAVKSISVVVPIAALFLLSGKIFSPLTALMVNFVGVAICISIPYFIGRSLGMEMTKFLEMKYPTVKKIDEFSSKNEWIFSYIARSINILPGDVVSLFLGSQKLNYSKYFWGSLCGMIPTMVSITLMGENITNPSSPKFLISLGVTVVFSLMSIPMYKFIRYKNH